SQDAVARSASQDYRTTLTDSLQRHLKTVNARLEPHEKLACLVVITTQWTPENGMVTPTLKVKRPRIEDVYAAHYAQWLSQGQPVVWASA
ncbi:MAG: AMP-binding acetyl-CoA synthetase, partial [Rhodoferax sp.]